jgi:hypothetical protein
VSPSSRLSSVFEAQPDQLPLAIDFQPQDGRIYGFVYGHLLNFLSEKNPDADLQPDAPTDRFSFWFSTHDVVLVGWRLSALVPLLRHGRIASIVALDPRYYALAEPKAAFISEIIVCPAQKE